MASCCPDVLSCLHLPADFLVHYGHACLTPYVPPFPVLKKLIARTDALPVHYVFPRQKLDVKEAGQALLAASSELAEGSHKGVMVVWDVSYNWLDGTSNVAYIDSRQTNSGGRKLTCHRGDHIYAQLEYTPPDIVCDYPSTEFASGLRKVVGKGPSFKIIVATRGARR